MKERSNKENSAVKDVFRSWCDELFRHFRISNDIAEKIITIESPLQRIIWWNIPQHHRVANFEWNDDTSVVETAAIITMI